MRLVVIASVVVAVGVSAGAATAAPTSPASPTSSVASFPKALETAKFPKSLEAATSPEVAAWPTGFHAWRTAADFDAGTFTDTVPADAGGVTLAEGATEGSWTSPWHSPSEPFTQAVPSWQADTPGGSWIGVELQVRTSTSTSQWYAMGDWAFDTQAIERQTYDKQSDELGRVATDTYFAASGVQATGFRLRTVLHGNAADTTKAQANKDDQANQVDRPVVRQLASAVSQPGELPDTSEPISDQAVELDVPAYSQTIHSGEYPKFGGGGQVWCSPTSTSMVLSYWGTGPTQADIDSLPPDKVFDANGRVDGQVDWAAIHHWDYTYDGAGNWAFSTAYASAYGLDGSVRQSSTLRDVEAQVRSGVPVVVSIDWDNTDDDPSNDLTGSSINSTNGHLMVVVGFTATGDVIANDPASPSNAEVRHVYQRDQLERNWLRASNGTTYVISG